LSGHCVHLPCIFSLWYYIELLNISLYNRRNKCCKIYFLDQFIKWNRKRGREREREREREKGDKGKSFFGNMNQMYIISDDQQNISSIN